LTLKINLYWYQLTDKSITIAKKKRFSSKKKALRKMKGYSHQTAKDEQRN
jgi:hypothetical protein